MYNSAYRRLGSRRSAVLVATTAALLGSVSPALADDGDQDERGTASAAVLRTGLDVSLLSGTAQVPLNVTLNEVTAPESESETVLSASLDGVQDGESFEVLRADVAAASAESDEAGSRAEVTLAEAKVHVPGLPLTSVIELEAVTASAICATGEAPVAEADFGAEALVLGQHVDLTVEGTTEVTVPGVGQVTLALSKTETTDTTAAATALDLMVSINPANLNVATVDGHITLAEAECTTAAGTGGSASGGSATEGSATEGSDAGTATEGTDGDDAGSASEGTDGDDTQSVSGGSSADGDGTDLAETGSDSNMPLLAGGAVALLGAGAGALFLARRRAARTTAAG
ncbi:SCO1860 family LAETG-anchored protein [Streptomyces sp. NBC_01803]|uniref:SCO1860 family LAETG-anchored protein n=1 Tax=Streptomyces sp. NBC_01803 TaxID=2975946 RepID=UPI002DD82E31|nr:SCO1860 family LAETG-anchored protein [Streptomyces sp. NBC_01803]WSA46817.1 LPXTG cell wall anchor domain-containing protein [Streptomyces sp. NBC_01803]